MEKTKRYRLLRDTPYGDKAGAIFYKNGEKYYEINGNIGKGNSYEARYVENNPEWFELIEDRVGVISFNGPLRLDGGFSYGFSVSQEIPVEKFTAVRKAIEDFLNAPAWFQRYQQGLIEQTRKKEERFLFPKEKAYTEKELLEAEERAFAAARKNSGYGINGSFFPLHKDFSDYKTDGNEGV